MNPERDDELAALYASAPARADDRALMQAILSRTHVAPRWRQLLLGAAGLAGLGVAGAVASASAALPAAASLIDVFRGPLASNASTVGLAIALLAMTFAVAHVARQET